MSILKPMLLLIANEICICMITTYLTFLTAIWLPQGQLWAIIEEAASLTRF